MSPDVQRPTLGHLLRDLAPQVLGAVGMTDTDTMLFGRRTYELFASYWPHAIGDSATAPDPHVDGRRTRTIRDMAVWINETPKLVFPRTRTDVTWRNSRLLPEPDPRGIEALKRQPGRDIVVFGSGSLVSQLTAHGLVDEYRFVVTPVLLGPGVPMLRDVPGTVKLDLLESVRYSSGNVALRYARTR